MPFHIDSVLHDPLARFRLLAAQCKQDLLDRPNPTFTSPPHVYTTTQATTARFAALPVSQSCKIPPSAFPHIWESIITFADASSVLALRKTSSVLRKEVDRLLLAHLVATGFNKDEKGSSVRLGYVTATWGQDTIRVPLPRRIPGKNKDVALRCGRLDIDDRFTIRDLYQLSSLLKPKLLRVPGGSASFAGRALEFIGAPTTVLSLADDQTYQAQFVNNMTLRENTERLVLHQRSTGYTWRNEYLLVRGANLRELVLVFHHDRDTADMDKIEFYLDGMIYQLPNASITIVGGNRLISTINENARRRLRFKKAGLTFYTLTSYRPLLSPSQWSLEMELGALRSTGQ
jgi:hypothetical protein